MIIIKIIMVNIVLSGDNAVVIAMASKHLPERERAQAVWWGAFGAVVLRIVLTAAALVLLKIPYIQMLGSLLLFYIAVKLLLDDEGHSRIKSAGSLKSAIWTIIVADFVMSLDNVLAIAAIAEGDWLLLTIGIAVSIPLIVWGSAFVTMLLLRYRVFIYIGAGILGYTAGEMFLADESAHRFLEYISPLVQGLIPFSAAAGVVLAGWIKRKKTL